MFKNDLTVYSNANPALLPPLIQVDIAARMGSWYIKTMGVLQIGADTVVWVLWEWPIGQSL